MNGFVRSGIVAALDGQDTEPESDEHKELDSDDSLDELEEA